MIRVYHSPRRAAKRGCAAERAGDVGSAAGNCPRFGDLRRFGIGVQNFDLQPLAGW